MNIANQTLSKIEWEIKRDQGDRYRHILGQVLPTIEDAYKINDFPFREHLGVSLVGNPCARSSWYSFRWYKKIEWSGRLLRLFNRGHLEEVRMISCLWLIGCTVYSHDANGKQYGFMEDYGHFGGSSDGVAVNIPDIGQLPALLEFKTSNNRIFYKIQKNGIRAEKPQHYVQMVIHQKKLNLNYGLYMCVNKNDDNLHAEIIERDDATANHYLELGKYIVFSPQPPEKISTKPDSDACKWCDFKDVCHFGEQAYKTCRSCRYAVVHGQGIWACGYYNKLLDKHAQLSGCENWMQI